MRNCKSFLTLRKVFDGFCILVLLLSHLVIVPVKSVCYKINYIYNTNMFVTLHEKYYVQYVQQQGDKISKY